MTLGRYALGWLFLAAFAAPSVALACALRAWLVPQFRGARARMAESVLVIAYVLTLAQLLGAVGWFKWLPLLLAGWVTAIPVTVWAKRRTPTSADAAQAPRAPSPLRRVHVMLAITVVAIPLARWMSEILVAFSGGPRGVDSLVYHLPTAARFVQDGTIYRLHFTLPEYLVQFVPFGGEIVHAIGMLAFHNDVLTPLINLGWFGLVLLAAWCCGQERSLGAVTMSAACIVLAMPLMVDTQAGSGLVDMPGLFLILSATAFLLDPAAGIRGSALAAVAMGTAIGIKSSLLVPAAAMFVGSLVVAHRAHRRRTALVWAVALAGTGGYSYLRNLIVVGNPFPGLSFHLGSWSLPSPRASAIDTNGFTVFHYLTRLGVWRRFFMPQLSVGFGRTWPLIALLAVSGAVMALIAGRGAVRMLGAVCVIGAVGYIFLPASAGGPDGNPYLFGANLRWVAPMILLALVLLPLAAPSSIPALRVTIPIGLLAAVLGSQWPNPLYTSLPARYRVPAVAVTIVAMAAALAAFRWRLRVGAEAALAGLTAVFLVAAAAGWPIQQRFLQHRYLQRRDAVGAAFVWARDVKNARIAVALIPQQYPLYGNDLSNHVQFIGRVGQHKAFHFVETCRQWRKELLDGRYTYVVTGPYAGEPTEPPEAEWTRRDPAADLILESGNTSVFRLDGRPNPDGCP